VGLAAAGTVERIVGFDLDPATSRRALELGAVHIAATSAAQAVEQADLVVVATPVGSIPQTFASVKTYLRSGAIVTDVGSTKSGIVEEISVLISPDVHFIGGHPMAGSEREGIEAATADLFRDSYWILTPTSQTDAAAYSSLVRFITGLGAKVLSLDADRHDEAVALTSHLPQILASTLMRFAADVAGAEGGLPLLASGGFRDMTRIAGSSPALWMGILKENSAALVDVLGRYSGSLESVRAAIDTGDWNVVSKMLTDARSARSTLAAKSGRKSGDLVEVRITVPDRPGVLADVATSLGEASINIEDLDIQHSPEGGRGILRILVEASDADATRSILVGRGFDVRAEEP
ncbi:MAG TPA: prephenate dehydrogenase, partial [Actinomycetota bacterium]|nr:prephenate dehydrogenase [Actinomycetota bacterium]